MSERRALLEAILYITDDPLTVEQLAKGLEWPKEEVEALIAELVESHRQADRGVEVRAIAGGYKISTKPEHHEAVRRFVKTLKPPMKLSIPALETLSVIAYKQPVTLPEIQEIRGVGAAGVIKTLLDRKLITTSGRKQVIGRPILYKTTREFLVQFGLNDLSELPSLSEFEQLSRAALGDGVDPAAQAAAGEPPLPQAATEQPSPEPTASEPVSETSGVPDGQLGDTAGTAEEHPAAVQPSEDDLR
ncbi:MAG TPA: SMC-Scp complex subunit ScpB [Bryobacterales bacterium]|jgi:segregation and condensation protein B|nr:SMC-Scp complex subunit ScpB [Bryobacterales bacterium]